MSGLSPVRRRKGRVSEPEGCSAPGVGVGGAQGFSYALQWCLQPRKRAPAARAPSLSRVAGQTPYLLARRGPRHPRPPCGRGARADSGAKTATRGSGVGASPGPVPKARLRQDQRQEGRPLSALRRAPASAPGSSVGPPGGRPLDLRLLPLHGSARTPGPWAEGRGEGGRSEEVARPAHSRFGLRRGTLGAGRHSGHLRHLSSGRRRREDTGAGRASRKGRPQATASVGGVGARRLVSADPAPGPEKGLTPRGSRARPGV